MTRHSFCRTIPRHALALAAAISVVASSSARAQGQPNTADASWNPQEILRTEKYVRPPAVIERIITAPRTDISFSAPSPDRRWFLKTTGPERGDVQYYGKAHIELAGLQIDTLANRARTVTTRVITALSIADPRTMATRNIEIPKDATVGGQIWSPNGSQVAYIANFRNASYVFLADAATGKSTQLTRAPLLATLVTTIDWTADGKYIVAVLVPEGRGPAPTHGAGGVEDGPSVRLTEGRKLPQVIHPSLLEDPHEKAMLKYYTTGQLALIDVKTKAVRKVGAPSMFRSIDVSPDGQFLRVTRMTEPFSYLVPIGSFGSTEELWDVSGKSLATLNTTPLREGDSGSDVDAALGGGRGNQQSASDSGKRNIQWNPTGAGLVYLQSVFGTAAPAGNDANPAGRGGRGGRGAGGRGGQPQRPQPTSVRYMVWMPPFGPNDTKIVYEGSPRLTNVAYSADARTMFVADSGTVLAMRTADPSKKYNLGRGVTLPGGGGGFGFGGGGRGGFSRRGQGGGGGITTVDTTVGGGALAVRRLPNGTDAVIVGSDGKTVYVSGTLSYGPQWRTKAPRPWVDKLDMETGQRTHIFESPADAYEQFVTALDDDYTQFIYTRQTPTVIADAYLRDTKTGTSTKITNNKDVGPEITGAVTKQLQITRPRDGFKFLVDVTFPPEYKAGTRFPGLIWFYPGEYTSQAEYDEKQQGANINRFPEVVPARPASTMQLWALHGYVLIETDLPIVGDSGKMNDNYTRDLRESLDAIIDAVVDSGYVDRNRMGLGGHSYGAFSTVNAMTLVPYFKAGIAGDGMYNRSLTPFGFQRERRTFFEAEATYLDMSPFLRADKLSGALLLYHSIEDQNVGTAPISSIRMFHALQGLGKTAALYLYPYEDHSVATYQTDLDQWARWFAWFDIYVKNAKADSKITTQPH